MGLTKPPKGPMSAISVLFASASSVAVAKACSKVALQVRSPLMAVAKHQLKFRFDPGTDRIGNISVDEVVEF